MSSKVSLMITCLGDALFPEVGVATVRLLRRLGCEVQFPRAQTCCGQPHFNSGYHDDARAVARHTIQAFAQAGTVVTPSGSCAAMVKVEYPELFRDDFVWHGPLSRRRRMCPALGDVVNLDELPRLAQRLAGDARDVAPWVRMNIKQVVRGVEIRLTAHHERADARLDRPSLEVVRSAFDDDGARR